MNIRPRNRRIGILLSGRGSNFEVIAANIDARKLNAEIAVVISNIETAPGLVHAQERGLNAVCISSKGKFREFFDTEVAASLKSADVGLVVLAGFMRIFSPVMLAAYPNLILNIHPSLLPSFPGTEVQQQALDYGAKFSGCTVHIVNEVLDGGPIVKQAVVPILDSDDAHTLAERILVEEHRIYSEAIDLVLSGRCTVDGRRVRT